MGIFHKADAFYHKIMHFCQKNVKAIDFYGKISYK